MPQHCCSVTRVNLKLMGWFLCLVLILPDEDSLEGNLDPLQNYSLFTFADSSHSSFRRLLHFTHLIKSLPWALLSLGFLFQSRSGDPLSQLRIGYPGHRTGGVGVGGVVSQLCSHGSLRLLCTCTWPLPLLLFCPLSALILVLSRAGKTHMWRNSIRSCHDPSKFGFD